MDDVDVDTNVDVNVDVNVDIHAKEELDFAIAGTLLVNIWILRSGYSKS